ncbi:ABC transporter ATP-binding protein [Herbiconiux sp.]|uniref:ABC transporter ATP-binding protein n=1 Tax=Herbiconiux sp. TaxID=1871186 RepID=UPI0025C15D92|nr:ABC transporter ATP-binding protein [Herbiconiux sp.]
MTDSSTPQGSPSSQPGPSGTLSAEGVTRHFAGVKALSDVHLEVPAGRITGLIGPNGAGKSTLVNILSGYDRPDEGRVLLGGVDRTRERSYRRTRRGVARTFQHGHIFKEQTILENVQLGALGVGRSSRAARREAIEILDRFDLLEHAGESAAHLPHGVERRLGVARALATRPTHLLLDEPAAGLNDGEMELFKSAIRSVVDDLDVGVLLIDHNMRLIFGACDHIHVLAAGANVVDGPPETVRADPRLAESYLGSMAATIAGGDDA